MTLRRLINTAYAFLTQEKSEKELAGFDAFLCAESEPEKAKGKKTGLTQRSSRGTGDLMAVLGSVQMPRPKTA